MKLCRKVDNLTLKLESLNSTLDRHCPRKLPKLWNEVVPWEQHVTHTIETFKWHHLPKKDSLAS
jgi:hypothetical protein